MVAARMATLNAVSTNRHYGWALATPAATLSFALLLNAVASHTLAPEGFGQFAVMLGLMTLLSALIGLGMPVTVVRFLASSVSPEERDRYRVAAWTMVIAAGATMTLALITLDASPYRLLDRWILPGSAFAVGIGAFGMALLDVSAAESQGRLSFRGYFARMVGGSGARVLGVVVALAVLGPTPTAGVIGYAAACVIVGGGLGIQSLISSTSDLSHNFGTLRDTIRQTASFGLPVVGSAVVIATIVYLDTLVVAWVLPDRDVGWYAAAGRLTVIQSTLIGGIASISLPVASRAVRQGRQSEFIASTLRYSAQIGVFVTVALVAASHLIVRVLYGSSFMPAATIFIILSIGLLPNFFANTVGQLLYARGRPGQLLMVHISQLAALLVSLPMVAMAFGITGVALWRSAVNIAAVSVVVWLAVSNRGRAPEAQ